MVCACAGYVHHPPCPLAVQSANPVGWICPLCKRGVSPSVARCPCRETPVVGPGDSCMMCNGEIHEDDPPCVDGGFVHMRCKPRLKEG